MKKEIYSDVKLRLWKLAGKNTPHIILLYASQFSKQQELQGFTQDFQISLDKGSGGLW